MGDVKVNVDVGQAVKNGENKFELSQNAKGFWYCTNITIYCENILNAIDLGFKAANKVQKQLDKLNKGNEVVTK